ncbi:LuxR C-terminal-related transcriptional regulator [Spirillospora sp. CA-108201]
MAEHVSEREAEVLTALGARMSNAQIAGRLHISVRTVESHVSSLLRKYGVPDRWALAELARSGTPDLGRVAGLPASGTTFVGRDVERADVLAALEEARLVTLLGPGGVGKTRLAAVVAGDAAALFPSGGAFVDLVPVRAGFATRALATALGVTEGSHQPLEEAVAARLGAGRSLLVLDNCEHLVDEAACSRTRSAPSSGASECSPAPSTWTRPHRWVGARWAGGGRRLRICLGGWWTRALSCTCGGGSAGGGCWRRSGRSRSPGWPRPGRRTGRGPAACGGRRPRRPPPRTGSANRAGGRTSTPWRRTCGPRSPRPPARTRRPTGWRARWRT